MNTKDSQGRYRDGSDIDLKNLENLFSYFNFEIRYCINHGRTELLNKLIEGQLVLFFLVIFSITTLYFVLFGALLYGINRKKLRLIIFFSFTQSSLREVDCTGSPGCFISSFHGASSHAEFHPPFYIVPSTISLLSYFFFFFILFPQIQFSLLYCIL